MLENILKLLNKGDIDKSLIKLLIKECTQEAIEYTHNQDMIALQAIIEQMVVYRYNLLGAEGLNSESYSGVSYNYSLDYPDSILRLLKSKRKLRIF